MRVHLDESPLWKADVVRPMDTYNEWFPRFACNATRTTRVQTTGQVEDYEALHGTGDVCRWRRMDLRL